MGIRSEKSEQVVKRVMVSSTLRDLPEHREYIKEACLRQGMLPLMMEHLPTNSDDAIEASLRLVDEADLYLGVFAYRYGYIPPGHNLSITEMEYHRAIEREIPRLIFIMHDEHSIKGADIERGRGAEKIDAFKEQVKKAQVTNFFKSPAELAVLVINSLSQYRVSDGTAFHYISEIPEPPEVYIAHPYVLLQTPTLLGRQTELNRLTEWVARPEVAIFQAHVLSIVAIGGMGKSALAWKWFHDIAPYEMKPLAGRMWWSFYESDASFENFVLRALAYVSHRSCQEVQRLSLRERETQLLAILDSEPFLLVLDGLERLLIAYARMDAARLPEDDLDQKTSNHLANTLGSPERVAQSFVTPYRLRKTADSRVGNFLRQLTTRHASRILISTRLYPADLQTTAGSERPGSGGIVLSGLADDDALNMWRAFGVSGDHTTLLPLFHTFENHPLLLQILAGVVAQDRRFPGDFDRWSMAHPDFSPFQLPLIQVKSHILAVALRGLDERSLKILQTLAVFRMPVGYHTLVDLFVEKEKSFDAEDAFITLLTDLEDRGLLGWDRRANRYDLHPIVRGVIWSHMVHQDKKMIYKTLKTHFQSVSMREEEREIRSLEDLAPIIELYNVLIGLRHFEDAFNLYWDRLNKLMVYHLSALRQVKELLELFFLDGLDQPPRLESPHAQSRVLNSLALSSRDQLEQAIDLKWRSAEIDQRNANWLNVSVNLSHLSGDLCLSGRIYEAETSARRALMIAKQQENNNREAVALGWLGSVLTKRGRRSVSWRVLQRSLCISHDGIARGVYTSSDDTSIRVNEASENDPEIELKRASCYHLAWLHPGYFFLAIYFLQYGQYPEAQEVARKHRILSEQGHYERGVIRAIRIQGAALLGLEELSAAEGHFHEALVRARKANLVEEELASLVGLSELHRRQGNLKAAREYLDDTWEAAEYGSFRLLQVDAWNILAQIERDAHHHSAAVEVALRAYRSAWCDGPPFTYYWGLEVAKSHLCALGVPEPIMPAFDPVQYEPMPDVEIDPLDEFYVGEM